MREAIRFWTTLMRDPLAAFDNVRAEQGDAARLRVWASRDLFVLSRPEHAEHVLVSHQERYVKAITYRPLKAFLRDGLLTSEGEHWQAHRRLIQPVFSSRHVQEFAPDMVAAARERLTAWRVGEPVDVAAEMRTFTMAAVGRILFGTQLESRAEPIGRAVTKLQDAVIAASLLPSRSARMTRILAMALVPGVGPAMNTLDELVDGIIDARLAHPNEQPRDLLDLLVGASHDGQSLTRPEIRDEVMTLVLAGHETTANTLTWTLVLLSRHPDIRARLHAELDEVLAGREPAVEDVDKLTYTTAVLNEALRLYPPAWTIERDSVCADDVAGVAVPGGSTVAVPPYLIHRHPEFWPNPEGFDPTRFLPGAAERPKYAYIPFGGGRRICLGAGFAQLEATLALATMLREHSLDLVPGADLRPRAGVTMHPAGAVPMTVRRRDGSG